MSSMLRKKEVFTVITPIPGFIPRQLAIDILHSHSEVITLNPLVLDHKPIKAPRQAASDEYYSTWYEITERIQYVPGLGRMGSGKISFNGCFHNMPWGLQTHIYAPLNVHLKNKYRIAGNQPGVEPPEQLEIGLSSLGAPSDGLYLRDDIEIKCNVAVVSFVKSQLKAASKEMVSRIIKKAELLDAGVLHAMIENGKLRTINPNDRSTLPPTHGSPQTSPTFMDRSGAMSPVNDEPRPYQVPRPASYQQYNKVGHFSHAGHNNPHWSAPYGGPPTLAPKRLPSHAELPVGGQQGPPRTATGTPQHGAVAEMPGDCFFPQPLSATASPRLPPAHPSPTYPPSDQDSNASRVSLQPPSNDWRWSQSQGAATFSSRPTSVSSERSGGGGGGGGGGGNSNGLQSPGLDQQGFTSELPTHNEDPEEGNNANADVVRRLGGPKGAQYTTPSPPQVPKKYAYNPADYVMARRQERERQRLQS